MRKSNPCLTPPGARHSPAANGMEWNFRRRNLGTPAARSEQFSTGQYRRSEKMARLEAALLVAEDALPARRLAHVATLADATEARTLIRRLNEFYDEAGTPFRVERVAAGYQLLTRAAFSFWLGKLHQRQAELKLSSPAQETLVIVAYRQPVIRADIEAIRGVQSTEMLKQLMERGLVRIAGNDDSLGRPFLYGTTRKFLEVFGLQSLDDLPMAERLRLPKTTAPPEEAEPEIAGSVNVTETDDTAEAGDLQKSA